MFVDDEVIRIITHSGLDCLFSIADRRTIINGNSNYKLLSFTKLDNFKHGIFDVENHAIIEKQPLDIGDDVFVRLVRKNQMQKSWLDQCTHLAMTESNKKRDKLLRISKQYEIDYNLDTGGESNAFIAELSFTVLDWIILDKI